MATRGIIQLIVGILPLIVTAVMCKDIRTLTSQWGSRELVDCVLPEGRQIQVLHWYYFGDGAIESYDDLLVTFYTGGNSSEREEHFRPGPNFSLDIIKMDYSIGGVYECVVTVYPIADDNFKAKVRIEVTEPPLRVDVCNSTSEDSESSSSPCTITIPNGTETVNVTVIKEGARFEPRFEYAIEGKIRMLPEVESYRNRTTHSDNSTTEWQLYAVDVGGMEAGDAATLTVTVRNSNGDAETKSIFFHRESSKTQSESHASVAVVASSSVSVVVIVVLIVLCVALLYRRGCLGRLVRRPQQHYSQSNNTDNGEVRAKTEVCCQMYTNEYEQ